MARRSRESGFTLVELLIVIAVIAILAAAVYAALNPQKRFQDARDARRVTDANAILSALKLYQIDNKGNDFMAINYLTVGNVYMIGAATGACNSVTCDTPVSSFNSCINISGLVSTGYLGAMPISPSGAFSYNPGFSGYTITRQSNGIIIVRACESEDTDEISVSR
jgi:prepilin-type N-terminal cleavage/methylation domain-containing protein